MIDLDSTFFIQFLNFTISLIVLNFLLIRPIRDIIKKRNDAMSTMVDEAENFTNSAEEKLQNYHKQLDQTRIAGTQKRNEMKDEGVAQEKGILSAAGEQASATLKAEREIVVGQVSSAMTALKGQVAALAGKVSAKVLG